MTHGKLAPLDQASLAVLAGVDFGVAFSLALSPQAPVAAWLGFSKAIMRLFVILACIFGSVNAFQLVQDSSGGKSAAVTPSAIAPLLIGIAFTLWLAVLELAGAVFRRRE